MVTGAAAPYLAGLVKEVSQDNESARIALHTVLGAFLAQAQGGSAAGGAAGGLVSSAGAQALTALLYPGVKAEELTGEQKELIANLITLAGAGAGGLIDGNLTGAGSGANTAKNEVENNALGADAGTAFGFWFGKTPDCDTDCKAEIAKKTAKGNAVVSAGIANTAGVASLSGPATAMWLLGAGANAGVQYADNGEVNPINAGIAGWVNVISMGNGLWGTVGWNAAGGALTNTINGDDPLTGAITNGAGAVFGYGLGKAASVGTNAAGKWITGDWEPKFNPTLLKQTEVKGQFGIAKEMLPSKLPGAVGNVTSSVSSESSGNTVQKLIDKVEKNAK
ncbi:putative adhesin [Brenneria sp. EniD312]|nr:putative adhesin [Brenneria sp. EniD312]